MLAASAGVSLLPALRPVGCVAGSGTPGAPASRSRRPGGFAATVLEEIGLRMSKSVTKTRNEFTVLGKNRMILRFHQRPDRAAGSFVTDLDILRPSWWSAVNQSSVRVVIRVALSTSSATWRRASVSMAATLYPARSFGSLNESS